MGVEKGKRLVPDSPDHQVNSQASSARPPSRRSDEVDDAAFRPPHSLPPTQQSPAESLHTGNHSKDSSRGHHQRSRLRKSDVSKQDGPEFSPDATTSRKHERKTFVNAKGGGRQIHKSDDGDDDRPPFLGVQQTKASRMASESPSVASADARDKMISSIPQSDGLNDIWPEFSPDTNASQRDMRRKAKATKSTSRKSGGRYGADVKGNPPATGSSRQVKRNTHEEPSFYDEHVSKSTPNTKSLPVSKPDGPGLSPDYNTARRKKSKKKLHTTEKSSARKPPQHNFAASSTRESGAKRTLPTNVASLTLDQNEDEKLNAKASLARDRALTPGAIAVSSSKQSAKGSKEIDEPQLYPDEETVYNDTKKLSDSSKKVSTGNRGISDVVESFQMPQGSEDMSSSPTEVPPETETSAGITPNFRPRPPRHRTTPGAFRVDGLDGPSDDNDYYDDEVSEARPPAPEGTGSLPIAKPANESNRHIIDGLGEAEPISPDDLKRQGIMGWIRQHRVISAVAILVVIGAVVGGIVGAKFGGGSPPPAPTLEPTQAPTSAPTLLGFETIAETLLTVTPYSVLTDPITPQNAALTWLMREDEYDIDFDNSLKLLQRYSLATIYFATGGVGWTNQLQFLTNQDDCLWNDMIEDESFGVEECNDQGLATKLRLSRNGLEGTLPDEVGGMPLLVEFGAADNSLSGSIPNGLTKLTELVDIYLFECGLSGTLPQDIGNLSKLTHLAMQTNSISGSLPTSFYDLTNLENMYLFQNSYSGSLAPGIGNFVSLKQMQLNANQFSGVIPSDVARMSSLVNIALEENKFTGGMESFCNAGINFNWFKSDCFFHETLAPDPEVSCSCCTICCRNDDTVTATCVPNDGTLF